MKAALIALLAPWGWAAAPAKAPAAPARPPVPAAQPYWFKTYSTTPYKEFWTSELAVKNLSRDLPKVVAAIEKEGGALTQPLADFVSSKKDHSQQASFSIPEKGGLAAVRALKKLGTLSGPEVRATGVPIPLKEVRAKIDAILKEKATRAEELKRVPAAAAAQEEILEHLLLVEEVGKRAATEVRWNLLIRQK